MSASGTTSDQRTKLRVGTRSSKLALIQTEYAIEQLTKHHPELQVDVATMKTIGDKIQDIAMSKIGDKGLFTKELEAALETGEIDFVVHSAKDMPTQLADNMELAAVMERVDPRDAVVMSLKNKDKKGLDELPSGSVVGTGSVRRVSQLRRLYPHLEFMDIRGNLNTRMAKLDAEDSPYAALVLAVAGMQRLGAQTRITQTLDNVLHAVGQGALGIEARADDVHMKQLVAKSLGHRPTWLACLAERQLMRALEGGCSVPIGVRTQWSNEGSTLSLQAIVASPDGAEAVEADASAAFASGADASAADACAVDLGARVAALMRERGASKILNAIHPPEPNAN
ncbi:hypothetical protein IWW48_004488 [Coemansia sp. RSA 1200]|nr:hypothetical protein IWW48_004488 [Coemansia sp. RSA 1200]